MLTMLLLLLAQPKPAAGEGPIIVKVVITIAGAGTFKAEGEGRCSHSTKPPITFDWGVSYTNRDRKAAFQTLLLSTKDTDSGSTELISLLLGAGEKMWALSTIPGLTQSGRGKASVKRAGPGAHIDVDGVTVDGERVQASIDCSRVTD